MGRDCFLERSCCLSIDLSFFSRRFFCQAKRVEKYQWGRIFSRMSCLSNST
jgi:hypothetical protein